MFLFPLRLFPLLGGNLSCWNFCLLFLVLDTWRPREHEERSWESVKRHRKRMPFTRFQLLSSGRIHYSFSQCCFLLKSVWKRGATPAGRKRKVSFPWLLPIREPQLLGQGREKVQLSQLYAHIWKSPWLLSSLTTFQEPSSASSEGDPWEPRLV